MDTKFKLLAAACCVGFLGAGLFWYVSKPVQQSQSALESESAKDTPVDVITLTSTPPEIDVEIQKVNFEKCGVSLGYDASWTPGQEMDGPMGGSYLHLTKNNHVFSIACDPYKDDIGLANKVDVQEIKLSNGDTLTRAVYFEDNEGQKLMGARVGRMVGEDVMYTEKSAEEIDIFGSKYVFDPVPVFLLDTKSANSKKMTINYRFEENTKPDSQEFEKILAEMDAMVASLEVKN